MNLDEIIRPLVNNKEATIIYLRSKGLLKNILYCEECKMKLNEVKYKRHIDGFAFRCYKSKCLNKMKYISIRKYSFFEKFNIELIDVLQICFDWFFEQSIKYVSISHRPSKNTVLKIFSSLRKKCNVYFNENPIRLGGNGYICQIDESMFKYKQKYHVGRISADNRWIFGIVDNSTSPSKYYVERVLNRSAEVLLPIINRICRDGSIIWSDEWRAYNNIKALGFDHHKVNHSLNFVNPNTGVNTQAVESLWNKLKRRVKRLMGIGDASLDEYLQEWMWKDNLGLQDVENLFLLMRY